MTDEPEICFCNKVLKSGVPILHPKTLCEPKAPDDRLQELMAARVAELEQKLEAAVPQVRPWKPEDLDRCEHGRHSIDPCFGCPGGLSTGNLWLTTPGNIPGDRIRIGTTLGGEPIYVQPVRSVRKKQED